jgi:hypothetical protein
MFDPTELTDSPRTPPRQIRKSRETIVRDVSELWERHQMAKHEKQNVETARWMAEVHHMEQNDKYTHDEILISMID